MAGKGGGRGLGTHQGGSGGVAVLSGARASAGRDITGGRGSEEMLR